MKRGGSFSNSPHTKSRKKCIEHFKANFSRSLNIKIVDENMNGEVEEAPYLEHWKD